MQSTRKISNIKNIFDIGFTNYIIVFLEDQFVILHNTDVSEFIFKIIV